MFIYNLLQHFSAYITHLTSLLNAAQARRDYTAEEIKKPPYSSEAVTSSSALIPAITLVCDCLIDHLEKFDPLHLTEFDSQLYAELPNRKQEIFNQVHFRVSPACGVHAMRPFSS
jgi:hypothetical protein